MSRYATFLFVDGLVILVFLVGVIAGVQMAGGGPSTQPEDGIYKILVVNGPGAYGDWEPGFFVLVIYEEGKPPKVPFEYKWIPASIFRPDDKDKMIDVGIFKGRGPKELTIEIRTTGWMINKTRTAVVKEGKQSGNCK